MSAEDALRVYAEKRTINNEGVRYINPLIEIVDNPEIYI